MKKFKLPVYVPWLYRNMRRRIPLILLQMGMNMVAAYIGVQFAMSTRQIINTAISGDPHSLLQACLIQVGLIVLMVLLRFSMRYCDSLLHSYLSRDFQKSLLHKVLHTDYSSISRFHTGDLINRMNRDASTAYGGVLAIASSLSSTVTAFFTAIAALLTIAPSFTLMIGLTASIAALLMMLINRKLKQLHKDSSAAAGVVSGFLYESISRLMLVQALDVSEEMERRADNVLEQRWQVQGRQRKMSAVTGLGSSILVYSTTFFTLAWSAWRLMNGQISYGDVSALLSMVGHARSSLMSLPSIIPQIVSISAACERVMDIELLPEQPEPETDNAQELYAQMTGVSFRSLTFSYDREPILKDVSLTIPKGGLTVITGQSGIGKSTMLKLMLGLYTPDTGTLTIDLPEGPLAISRAARALFSYAPQGNFLLSGTLRENLTLTNPRATDEQIRQALYVSAMDEYVSTLPEGLDTRLRENGAGLSEGQAQRLSLARALLSGAPILLLDEVTSALDSATEQLVLERICAMPGKTCIAVTHRPAALELADHFIEVTEDTITLTSKVTTHE